MMKFLQVLIVFVLMAGSVNGQALKLMSYNIRYNNPFDSENCWDIRKCDIADQLNFYEPDILGVQEALYHQVLFLDSCLAGYSWFGVGRDDGKTKGEYCAIFYKADNFTIIAGNTFWLSETPDKISKGWDAALERICTYILFRSEGSGKQFYVFNTHFDHLGEQARFESARLILQIIDSINGNKLPVVLMGDLNLEPNSEGIQYISQTLSDAKHVATMVSFGPNATFNEFNFNKIPTRRIDYIFTSKNMKIEKYAVLTDSKDGRYFSDHFPVFVHIRL